jgi:hypothetical protein
LPSNKDNDTVKPSSSTNTKDNQATLNRDLRNKGSPVKSGNVKKTSSPKNNRKPVQKMALPTASRKLKALKTLKCGRCPHEFESQTLLDLHQYFIHDLNDKADAEADAERMKRSSRQNRDVGKESKPPEASQVSSVLFTFFS